MSKYGSPSDCIIVCNSFDMRAVRPTSDHLAGRKNSRSQLFDRANIFCKSFDTETPHTLEAIKITQQYYGNLPEMKFRDWANLIKTVKFENESDGSSICSNL